MLGYVTLILKSLLGIIYVPYLLRMLGASEYGVYSLCSSVVGYLSILDFGFGAAVIRYSSKFRAEGDSESESRLYGLALLFFSAISIVVFLVGIAVCLNLNALWGSNMTADELLRAKVMIALLFANLGLSFPLNVFVAIVTAYEEFTFQKTLIVCSIVGSTVSMIALLSCGYRAIALVVVQTIANLTVLTGNLAFSVLKLHVRFSFSGWNVGYIKEIFLFSFWIFLCSCLDQVYWNSGQFILGCFYIPTTVAIFSVALQLKTIYMNISTVIVNLLLPKMTHMVTTGSSDAEISAYFTKVGRMQYLILGFLLSAYIVFGQSFIVLWAGPAYRDAYPIGLWLLLPLTLPLAQNLGIVILQARNQMRFRSLCFAGIAVVCIVLEVVFSKLHGAVGCAAAIGTTLLLGQGLVMNLYYHFRQRIDIARFLLEIGKMSVCPAILIAASLFSFTAFHVTLTNWFSLTIAAICFSAAYALLIWTTTVNREEKALILSGARRICPVWR